MSEKRRHKDSSALRSDEADRLVAMQKDQLYDKMESFLRTLPQLSQRFGEFLERARKANPNSTGLTSTPSFSSDFPTTPTTPHPTKHHGKKDAKKRKLQDGGGGGDGPTTPTTPTSTSHSSKKHHATGDRTKPEPVAVDRSKVEAAKDLPCPPDNSELLTEMALVKAESFELGRSLDAVTSWIALMVPAIKDEDNAGVEVQMQVANTLQALEKDVEAKYSLEQDYLEARATMESKYYKYFLAPSWIRMIESIDRKSWDDVELAWKDLQNILLIAYTTITLNMEKLKNPRQSRISNFMTM